MATGTVKFFSAEEGWGAISSPELPDDQDAFVHFSVIESEGYRYLVAGDEVDFDYVRIDQHGFRFVATRARKGEAPSAASPAIR
ncbi:cold-shock protein [Glaciihabitans sp. INWT7]|uniref:cold-shock protein n=1 Tax=Glaciihabitans sp. INWT7 TaxID=2596912 RepID=UPI00185F9757|nr:cold shock domain-containing protein [Glaciihabitans sp. INWT7]QNE45726.1 cold-shock protein [Glaciihabitans sp. INWT7]